MRTNHVKAKLASGQPALGAWLNLPSVGQARIMARLGFDWLAVDAEHAAQTPSLVADTVAAIADAGTCAPFVRLPCNNVEWFKWSLDAGAWGVIVPMVNTREEAQQAVSWSKYPPEGVRSIGGVFGAYGFATRNQAEYTQSANREVLVAVQIESAPGLEHIEEIVSVPGVDVAFIGPNDLHAQLGLTPSSEGAEPEFIAALDRIKSAAQQHNVYMGIFSSNGEAAAQRVREGFQMISVVTDVACLMAGAVQHLERAREHTS